MHDSDSYTLCDRLYGDTSDKYIYIYDSNQLRRESKDFGMQDYENDRITYMTLL